MLPSRAKKEAVEKERVIINKKRFLCMATFFFTTYIQLADKHGGGLYYSSNGRFTFWLPMLGVLRLI